MSPLGCFNGPRLFTAPCIQSLFLVALQSPLKTWSLFSHFLDLGSYIQLILPRKWGRNDNVPVLSPGLRRPSVCPCCFLPAALSWQHTWTSLLADERQVEHHWGQSSPATPRSATRQPSPAKNSSTAQLSPNSRATISGYSSMPLGFGVIC